MKTYDLTDGLKAARDRMTREPDPTEELIQEALGIKLPDSMTEMDLLAAKTLVDNAMNALAIACSSIQGQIDEANLRRDQEGEFSDPSWYKRVHGAKRAKSWQRQRLQDKLGDINRRLRRGNALKHDENRDTREGLFVQIAKLQLPPPTFQRLWQLVDETIKSRKGE